MRKFIGLTIILLFMLLSFGICYSSNVENIENQIKGYNLQIDKANHYIEYAIERGVDVQHLSILNAISIINESQESIELLESQIDDATEKDLIAQEIERNEMLLEIEEYYEKSEKIQLLMDVLHIDTVENIPIELLVTFDLLDCACELLEIEGKEIPISWNITEDISELEEKSDNKNIENSDMSEVTIPILENAEE